MTPFLAISRSCASSMRWYGLFVVVLVLGIASGDEETPETPTYGVDVSFPMQHAGVAASPRPFGDDIGPFYEDFVQGCRDFYKAKKRRCDQSEKDRIHLNINQPPSMQNYTSAGYAKVELPKPLFKQLQDFWQANQGKERVESWPAGNTYTNHWKAPTYMLPVQGSIKNLVTSTVKSTLEAWSGQSLIHTSFYGIRVYKEGAVLAPHIDRMPLVTSAIINVAQDVDEPWVLEVVGHDGIATNITMEPGDMVLYESHTVLHGRPFPMKGRYYANIFCHFEPVGHTERHHAKAKAEAEKAKQEYQHALASPSPPTKKVDDLPEYIEPGSEEEEKWRQQYVYKVDEPLKKTTESEVSTGPKTTTAHTAAASGDLFQLKQMAKEDKNSILAPDVNGWKPIHEAARGGHANVVEYLIKNGADVNERTNSNQGGTPLWWAEQLWQDDHPVVVILRKHGAVNKAPLRDNDEL